MHHVRTCSEAVWLAFIRRTITTGTPRTSYQNRIETDSRSSALSLPQKFLDPWRGRPFLLCVRIHYVSLCLHHIKFGRQFVLVVKIVRMAVRGPPAHLPRCHVEWRFDEDLRSHCREIYLDEHQKFKEGRNEVCWPPLEWPELFACVSCSTGLHIASCPSPVAIAIRK